MRWSAQLWFIAHSSSSDGADANPFAAQLTVDAFQIGYRTTGLRAADLPSTPFDRSVGQDTPHDDAVRRLEGMRILIVEDEALVALDLQFAIEDEGAIVIGPALSLPDALDLITREMRIDGAILDVDLAGLDVYPAAELLRGREVPFVFHTGHGSRASLSERFPGSLTCSKPTLPATLITALLRA